jgi:hypothetical protein
LSSTSYDTVQQHPGSARGVFSVALCPKLLQKGPQIGGIRVRESVFMTKIGVEPQPFPVMTLQVSRNTGFYHVGIKGLNEFFRECYHECLNKSWKTQGETLCYADLYNYLLE